MLYNLDARFDARQSFYNKAKVLDDKDTAILLSYDTEVAVHDKKKNVITVNDNFFLSNTTRRHIREFVLQNGGTRPKTVNLNDVYELV